jgi:hypothetical protein
MQLVGSSLAWISTGKPAAIGMHRLKACATRLSAMFAAHRAIAAGSKAWAKRGRALLNSA